MFLKLDALTELHAKWEKMKLPELNAELDVFTSELSNLSEPLTDELKESIKNFIQTVPMNSGFGVSSVVVRLYDKITNHEQNDDVLETIDFRVLQKIIADSKPTTINQMRAVDSILKETSRITEKFGKLEEKSRLISSMIVKLETENVTGLKYSEEDNANSRPSEQNTPASLHVVKDEEEKVAKGPKKVSNRSKAATAKQD